MTLTGVLTVLALAALGATVLLWLGALRGLRREDLPAVLVMGAIALLVMALR